MVEHLLSVRLERLPETREVAAFRAVGPLLRGEWERASDFLLQEGQRLEGELLRVEVALARGAYERAERLFRTELARTVYYDVQAQRAVLRALQDPSRRVAAPEASAERRVLVALPWRSPEVTERVLAAIHRGWGPEAPGWPDRPPE